MTGHICYKGYLNNQFTSFTVLLQKPNQQATPLQTTATHIISEQIGYEGDGKRGGEEVALDKAEIHDKEEKMQDTSLYNGYYTKTDR